MITNEVVDVAKKEDNNILLFKIDFEKAYDTVDHKFLIDMLRAMNFDFKWCDWIKHCIQSAPVSILVNGSPTPEFCLEKGIRQRGPLSPFFCLVFAECPVLYYE